MFFLCDDGGAAVRRGVESAGGGENNQNDEDSKADRRCGAQDRQTHDNGDSYDEASWGGSCNVTRGAAHEASRANR